MDANFAGDQKFELAGDGNRPVFVSTASIDPATGAVSAAESRRVSEFGRVARRVSDLRGYGGQLTLGLAPDVFKFRALRYGAVHVAELHAAVDAAGSSAASTARGSAIPERCEWAPSPSDARHVVVVTGGIRHEKVGVVTLFARGTIGTAIHSRRAGRRERRRPRLRPRVHSKSGKRDRPRCRRVAPHAARRGIADVEALRRGVPRTRRGRATDAVDRGRSRSTCSGAHRCPRRWGGRVDAERVPAERPGRSRSARARQQRARVGIARHAGPRAVRAARIRRERAALPLRRESALRRHAAESYAAARAVPHRDRLLAAALDQL